MISANSSHHSSAGSHLCILLAEREKALIVATACVCMRPGCHKLLRRIVQCWIHCLGLFFVRVCVQNAAGRLSPCATATCDTTVRLCSASGIQLFRCIQLLHNLDSPSGVCETRPGKIKYVTGHLITQRERTRLCVCSSRSEVT